MAASVPKEGLNLETPAIYRICVQGHLDRTWSDRLCGMSISAGTASPNAPTTILEGHLADQAALSGVLNALYDLRLPLLKVEYLKSPQAATSRRPKRSH